MKRNNVLSDDQKISVQIFSGLELICNNDNFNNVEDAAKSAERIVESQKNINGPSDTTYACVFSGRMMVYYFD